MKKSTKVIVSSVLSMALCASLIAGSTFALFSSEADVNVAITAGKVDVKASVDMDTFTAVSAKWDDTEGGYVDETVTDHFTTLGTWAYNGGTLTLSNIAPGDGVSFNLVLTNTSTIAIQYRVQLTVPEYLIDDGTTAQGEVVQALEVTFGDGTPTPIGTRTMLAQPWKTAEKGAAIEPVRVKIQLPVGVESHQGETCQFQIGVYAVQANAHVEDTDPDAAYTIYNAIDLYRFAKSVNDGNTYEGKNVELASDIYLGDSASKTSIATVSYALADVAPLSITDDPWTPIGHADSAFMGTFHGNNHTIYGLKVSGEKAGLFGVTGEGAKIQDVTLSGAEIEAADGGMAGALVAEAKGSLTVSGVKVEESVVKKAAGADATIGALVGSAADTTVTVHETDVNLSENGDELGGSLVGAGVVEHTSDGELRFEPVEGFLQKIVITNGKEQPAVYEISTADGLRYFADTVNGTNGLIAKDYAGETVYLTAEKIDLENKPWTPIGKVHAFRGSFDGNYNTIYNLRVVKDDGNTYNSAGLFGKFTGQQIDGKNSVFQNLTIENVEIPGSSHPTDENPHGDHNNMNDVGAFAGTTGYVDLKNLKLTGDVYIRGNNRVGGIVGQCNAYNVSEIRDITVDTNGTIWAGTAGGGIFGKLYTSNANVQINMSNIVLKDATVKAQQQSGGVIGVISITSSTTLVLDGVEFTDAKLVPYNPYSDAYKQNFGVVVGLPAKGLASEVKNLHGNISVELDPTLESNTHMAKIYNNGLFGKGDTVPTVSGDNTLDISWYGLKPVTDTGAHGFRAETKEALLTLANNWSAFAFTNETDRFLVELADTTYDLSDVEWPGLGMVTHFKFNGNNAVIKNMNTGSARTQAGFFNNAQDAVISDLTIENGTIVGDQAAILDAHGASLHLSNITLKGNFTVDWKDVDGENCPGIGVLVGGWGEGVKDSTYSDVKIAEGTKISLGGSPAMEAGVLDTTDKKPAGKLTVENDANRLLGYAYSDADGYTLPAGITVADDAEITYGYVVSTSAELISAIAEVNKGTVSLIKLGGDITYEGNAKSKSPFTFIQSCDIDLNGKTLTIHSTDGYDGIYMKNGGTYSVKNGKIEMDKLRTSSTYPMFLVDSSNLEMNQVTLNYIGAPMVWPNPSLNSVNHAYNLAGSGSTTQITLNECEINGNVFLGSGPNMTANNSTFNGSWRLTNTGSAALTMCTLTGAETDYFETGRAVTITDSIVKVKMYLSGNSSAKFDIRGGTVESDVTFSNNSSRPDSFNATGTTFKGDRYIGAGEGNVRENILTDCIFEGNLTINVEVRSMNNTTLSGCTIKGKLIAEQKSRVKLTNGTSCGSVEGSITQN